jgi:hypothetical protein
MMALGKYSLRIKDTEMLQKYRLQNKEKIFRTGLALWGLRTFLTLLTILIWLNYPVPEGYALKYWLQ